MKQCPVCLGTYPDDTISYCPADGSLLSPPFGSTTDQLPATEILQPARAATSPKQAAISTIASQSESRVTGAAADLLQRKSRFTTWFAVVVGTVGAISGVLAINQLGFRHDKSANSLPQPGTSRTANSPQASGISSTSGVGRVPPETPSRQNTPVAAAANDGAKVFGGREVDQKVTVISKPEPSYTEEARRNQVSGVVVLRAVFSSSGMVTNIYAVSGLPDGLTERAIDAARQIKFTPAMKDGRPVSMWVELQYNFNLY